MEIESEKAYESYLVDRIRSGSACNDVWVVDGKTGNRETLGSYLVGHEFEVVQDSSNWKKHKEISIDLIGGMVPDIAVNSMLSEQNRILIEVKWSASLNYEKEESQLIRYFIYLIASTTLNHKSRPDIKRAVLLAAPKKWFSRKNLNDYEYYVNNYYAIGEKLGIKVGKIECDAIQ